MIIGLYVGLFIAGLIALIKGKLTLGKNRVATKAAARVAGAVFLLPVPLAFGILMIVAFVRVSEGKAVDNDDWKLTSSLIELGVCVFCALAGFGIALAGSAPPEPEESEEEGIGKRTNRDKPITVLPVEHQPEGISHKPLPARTKPALAKQGGEGRGER